MILHYTHKDKVCAHRQYNDAQLRMCNNIISLVANYNYVYQYKDHLGNVRLSYIIKNCIADKSDVAKENDYYPYGMLLNNRHGSVDSDSYRYGFNSMERDDEIKNEGNSYTTFFRKFDPRLGRTFSLDPVMRSELSMYSMMSNSPIIMIDPRGDDDYFSVLGVYLGSDNKKSNFIKIVCEGNESTFYNSLILGSESLELNSNFLSDFYFNDFSNANMLTNISNYYADKMGISKITGVTEHINKDTGERKSVAYNVLGTERIYISTNKLGEISRILDDAYNLSNIVVHEDDHRNNPIETGPLLHTKRYLKQIDHPTFENTTKTLKYTNVIHVADYLNEYLGHLKNESRRVLISGRKLNEVKEVINEFNLRSLETGYQFYLNEENRVLTYEIPSMDEVPLIYDKQN